MRLRRPPTPKAEPTPTLVNGVPYFQAELADAVAKEADRIGRAGDLVPLIGDNPFASPVIARGLGELLVDLRRANAVLDLLLLLLDDDDGETPKRQEGEQKEEPKKKEKTTAEKNEELVDGWKAELKAAWEKDECVQKHQKFDDYWKAVKDFMLVGGAGYKGWLEELEKQIAKIGDEKRRGEVRDKFIKLGKKIAAEWAKANKCRKIRSSDVQLLEKGKPALTDFKKKLEKAVKADKGDGKEIEKALDEIDAEVDKALGK